MPVRKFSEAEIEALIMASRNPLSSVIADKQVTNDVGGIIPGWRVFRKLEREGFLFETEEEPVVINGEPFTFTTMVCLTETGERAMKIIRGGVYEIEMEGPGDNAPEP